MFILGSKERLIIFYASNLILKGTKIKII